MRTNNFKPVVYFFFLVNFVFILTACGGGGGGSSSATNNLAFKSIEVTSTNPEIGHPLAVSVSIDAAEATENVSVALFAIDKDSTSARQLPLGELTIGTVTAGSGSYDLLFNVPASVQLPGAYYIAAIIDPLDTVNEINEQDNEATTTVTLALSLSPNIFIETMSPDRSVITLDRASYDYAAQITDGVVNSDAGGTVSFGMQGSDSAIEVEAFAYMRLRRSDTNATHDVPLYLWNTDLSRYMNAYGIDPATSVTGIVEWLPIGAIQPQIIEGVTNQTYNDVERVSAHLDFYFPGQLSKEIETVLRDDDGFVFYFSAPIPPPDLSISDLSSLRSYLVGMRESMLSSELCVEIRPVDSGIVETDASDNEICSPLAFVIPPLPAELVPLPVEETYIPKWGNPTDAFYAGDFLSTGWQGDHFGYEVVFGGNVTADEYGLKMRGFGQLPVNIFGSTFTFIDTSFTARVIPNVVYTPQTQAPGFLFDLNFLDQLVFSSSLPYGDYPVAGRSVSRQKTVEKKFVVYGIVITVAGGGMGSLGTEVDILFNETQLQLVAAPFIKLEAIASANANAFLAEIGAEAAMTLVEERIELGLGSTVQVINNGFTGGVSEVEYQSGLTINNVLKGANGNVKAYVGVFYPTMVRCSWGIFGRGYCPGTDSIRYYKELAKWSGWEKTDPLLTHTQLIDVITLEGPDHLVYYVDDNF